MENYEIKDKIKVVSLILFEVINIYINGKIGKYNLLNLISIILFVKEGYGDLQKTYIQSDNELDEMRHKFDLILSLLNGLLKNESDLNHNFNTNIDKLKFSIIEFNDIYIYKEIKANNINQAGKDFKINYKLFESRQLFVIKILLKLFEKYLSNEIVWNEFEKLGLALEFNTTFLYYTFFVTDGIINYHKTNIEDYLKDIDKVHYDKCMKYNEILINFFWNLEDVTDLYPLENDDISVEEFSKQIKNRYIEFIEYLEKYGYNMENYRREIEKFK